MTSIRKILVDNLESQNSFGGRYDKIKCINYCPDKDDDDDNKRGKFSLVFQAHDKIEDTSVAIKFYDPKMMSRTYRLQSFEREPEILKHLLGKNRCLQLISDLKPYTLEMPVGNEDSTTIDIPYFIIEWIDHEIDKYFKKQESFDPIIKLRLFNEITFAIDSLHNNGIHHRDLKDDNLRARNDKDIKRIIVAIDLGAAARYDSKNLKDSYEDSAGWDLYSSPESLCGLAGDRAIAKYTDYYSLGCLLYELFNMNMFGNEFRKSYDFDKICAALSYKMYKEKTLEKKEKVWSTEVKSFKHSIKIPNIDDTGSTAPKVISHMLQIIIDSLTAFDYNDRPFDLHKTRRLINSSIRVLQNEREAAKILQRKKERRIKKIEKLKEKESRLKQYLSARKVIR